MVWNCVVDKGEADGDQESALQQVVRPLDEYWADVFFDSTAPPVLNPGLPLLRVDISDAVALFLYTAPASLQQEEQQNHEQEQTNHFCMVAVTDCRIRNRNNEYATIHTLHPNTAKNVLSEP